MKPNMVADAMGLRWDSPERIKNRYEVLKRERLPMAMHWMELEWRDHPVKMAQRLFITNSKVTLWLFITFFLSTLIAAPFMRLYGSGLFSPVTYPVICFLCGIAAYFRFRITASLSSAAWVFIVPQAAMILLELAFSPGIDSRLVVLPVAAAVIGVGYFADRINTHYVRWITANLKLKPEAARRRREMWDLRFDWKALTKEIEEQRERARTFEAGGQSEEALICRKRAGELRELRQYPFGFVVLVYLTLLLFIGAPSTVLLVSGLAASVCLAFRRPLITMKLSRLIAEVIVHSFVSWFSWDTLQDWVNSPGMFRDGLSSPFSRIRQTIICFLLIEFSFIPPIHLWGIGESRTPIWLWTSGYAFFLNLLLPAVLLICTLIATGARPLWLHLEAIEWADASEELESTGHFWDAVVGRLQGSSSSLEREHIWLGTHAEYGYPVLLHRPILKEHEHVQGDSGSGKTSRAFATQVTQLIRAGDSAVVIADLKRDMALFETVRIEAQRHGRVFKHVTNVLGLSSYLFNPFQELNSATTSISQFVETLMESLRLNHGDGYGTRYFSIQSRDWLLRTVKRFPYIASFDELYEKAGPEFFRNEAEMDRCREAISVIQQIADIVAMNWKPQPGGSDRPLKEAVFMPDVVEQGQIIYFSLPAIGETSTVKEFANLVLFALMTAQKNYREKGGRKQTYLFIDEFQQMASEGFKLILRQARTFGLSLILSNQSESDLMSRQTSRLLDTVRANTQVKLYFSVHDPNTIKMLEKASGLICYEREDGMIDYRPRLTVNDITRYSSDPELAICWITRDSGFTAYGGDWFGLRTSFHIDEEEFQKRDWAEWPAATEETIVAQRSAEGATTFSQGSGEPAPLLFATDLDTTPAIVVPRDSKWAKRLNQIYQSRSGNGVRHEA
jgi:hypothetical protein